MQSEDCVVFDAALALDIGRQRNRVLITEAATGLQVCYYAGSPVAFLTIPRRCGP